VERSALISLVWLAALAAGCAKRDEEAHPVSWYLQHESLIQAKSLWCLDDEQRQRTADCMNAMEAKRRLQVGSQKTLAPIDWGAAKTTP
jgi:hypothetical protein